MYHLPATLGGFLHLEWLSYLATPLVVYVQGPAKVSVIIPSLVCLCILRHAHRPSRKDVVWLASMFFAGLALSFATAYWSHVGLHFFSAGELLWPTAVWILGPKRFSPWLAYLLTFFGEGTVDIILAGYDLHWIPNFWFGVGGAGWHDGLFIAPLTALLCAWFLAGLWWAQQLVQQGKLTARHE